MYRHSDRDLSPNGWARHQSISATAAGGVRLVANFPTRVLSSCSWCPQL